MLLGSVRISGISPAVVALMETTICLTTICQVHTLFTRIYLARRRVHRNTGGAYKRTFFTVRKALDSIRTGLICVVVHGKRRVVGKNPRATGDTNSDPKDSQNFSHPGPYRSRMRRSIEA